MGDLADILVPEPTCEAHPLGKVAHNVRVHGEEGLEEVLVRVRDTVACEAWYAYLVCGGTGEPVGGGVTFTSLVVEPGSGGVVGGEGEERLLVVGNLVREERHRDVVLVQVTDFKVAFDEWSRTSLLDKGAEMVELLDFFIRREVCLASTLFD
jgi:hypothetical protein